MEWTRKQQEQIRDAWDALEHIAYETDTSAPSYLAEAYRDEKRATTTSYDARRLLIREAANGARLQLGDDPSPNVILPGDLYGMRDGIVKAFITGGGLARKNTDKVRAWIERHADPVEKMAQVVQAEHFANI